MVCSKSFPLAAGFLGLTLLFSACADRTAEGEELLSAARMASAAASSPDVVGADGSLGTIEATMNGEPRVWYVVTGQATDGPYSSAVWLEVDGGTIVSLGGLDSENPPIATFSRGGVGGTGASMGDYQGSALNLQMRLPEGASSAEFTFPGSESGGGVVFLADAAVVEVGSMLTMATGALIVDGSGREGDKVRVRGTFSGTLQTMAGSNPVQITEGRFDVSGIPSVAAITGGEGR